MCCSPGFVSFKWCCETTAKSNLLNENEIKRYSLPSSPVDTRRHYDVVRRHIDIETTSCVHRHGATVTYFMAILQSIDYNKFEGFSNVADEISLKFLSSFRECEVLVVVSDRNDFEFSIKAAERKRRTEDSTHIQETEIIYNRKVPKSFQIYLGNSNNKSFLVKYVSYKWRKTIAILFNLL